MAPDTYTRERIENLPRKRKLDMTPAVPLSAQVATARPASDLGPLPEWDLRDLYPGRESSALAQDLAQAEGAAKEFRATYAGKLAALSGEELGAAIAAYERLDEVLSRVMSYAELAYSGDQSNPELAKFYQTMQERVNEISTQVLFFTLEINRLDDAVLAEKLKTPG